jgi:hypothetical protein
MPKCIAWGEERSEECSQTEDRGRNECAQSRDEGYRDCCDWWPCDWACKAWTWVSNIVCIAWNWISNVVCVAWTWVTTAICVFWDVISTVVNAILVTIESIVGWVLSAVAFLVELVFAIPIIGALLRWVWNSVTHIIYIVFSFWDTVFGLIGIRPEKKLRICTIILKDESGDPISNIEFARTLLQLAVDVYKRDANVRILPLRPFKYSTGFDNAETVDESWVIFDNWTSDSDLLDIPCNAGSDWLLTGSGLQFRSSTLCFSSASWRRVLGYGAPITCFIIRSVGGDLGCDLWVTDYITIQNQTLPFMSPRTIGHELGHACNLFHTCVDNDNQNIMATTGSCDPTSSTNPDRINPRISNLQAIAIRMSKHVTYF